jgi:diguanylate cyclase (GGDEF)-like protein/PAS domain S-box-containing protein
MATKDGMAPQLSVATERTRLEALRELHILDTPAEQPFDDLVWLAAKLCDTPIALLSLVDGERQWFKARHGLHAEGTPRSESFCVHALQQDGCFEVEDARLDARFASLPLVAGEAGVRFYAGMPLVSDAGHRLGTLCVLDTRARRLDGQQREALVRLARRAMDSLETRRRHLRAERRERTLARLLEAMPDAVVTCGADGLLGEFNKAAREWHGVDPRALPPQDWARHFDLYDADGLQPLPTQRIPLLRAWRGEQVREAAIVIRAAGQPPRTVLCNAEPLLSADGQRLGAVCVMHDISGRLAAEARLRESEHYMRTVADNVPALIAHVGADLRYRFANRTYAQWFGLEPAALVGRHMSEVLRREHYLSVLPRLQQVLAGELVTFDLDVVRRDGELRHMRVTYVPDAPAVHDAPGPGRCAGFHLMVHDLTEQTRLARMLHERAMTDALTGLPNRAAWMAELARGVARAHRAGVSAAVMFLDLDGFKQVNDRYGHAAGDALLCEFAHRLRNCLRRSDFVARLAGDEFVVLLDGVTHPELSPQTMAGRVLRAMEAPLHVDGQALQITPSIGVALQKSPGLDAAQLMQKADEAMYAAKRSPQAGCVVVEC